MYHSFLKQLDGKIEYKIKTAFKILKVSKVYGGTRLKNKSHYQL